MKGLIIKDIFNSKSQWKSLLFVYLIYAIVFLPSSGPTAFVSTCTVVCSMLILTTFSYDEMSNWNKSVLTMPVSKKNIVLSKYISFLLFLLLGLGASILGVFISSILIDLDLNDFWLGTLCGIYIAIYLMSVTIPLLYKFKIEQARILMFLAIFIPAGAIYFIFFSPFAIAQLTMPTDNQLHSLLLISPIIMIAVISISFFVSLNIFKKVEV